MHEDQPQLTALENAILGLFREHGAESLMPSAIVGGMRRTHGEKFDSTEIRPALDAMHRRRILARRGSAYCLPEHVPAIREQSLESLESEEHRRKHMEVSGHENDLGQQLDAMRRWTGFDD